MADSTFVYQFVPAEQGDRVTLLLLHGTGGDERDLIPVGQSLLPGAALLSPRGKVLENGMPRFFRRFAEGVFDVEDIRLRARELAQFVEAASKDYGFDEHSVVAVGYSNGANIAAALLLLEPRVLAGAVLFRAMVPLEPETPPNLSGVSVFLAAGDTDTIVPRANVQRLAALLREGGASVSFEVFRQGHELGPDEMDMAREWLAARWGTAKGARPVRRVPQKIYRRRRA
jgi:predicted esterase